MAQKLKNLAHSVGDWVSIPGWERSLGEGKGNPLNILAWRIPQTLEPGRRESMGSHSVRYD